MGKSRLIDFEIGNVLNVAQEKRRKMKEYDVTLQIIIEVEAENEEEAFLNACKSLGLKPSAISDREVVELDDEGYSKI